MHGKLVALRRAIPEDSPHYFRWINNKALVLKNSDYKTVSATEHKKWFESILLNQHIPHFSIVENQKGILIGSCSLRNIDQTEHAAELQIRIGEADYHNRGFGSEAISLLVRYGFYFLNLKRIYLNVFGNNSRAIKAYEKCGFEHQKILKQAACIDGDYLDIHVMSITKDKTI